MKIFKVAMKLSYKYGIDLTINSVLDEIIRISNELKNKQLSQDNLDKLSDIKTILDDLNKLETETEIEEDSLFSKAQKLANEISNLDLNELSEIKSKLRKFSNENKDKILSYNEENYNNLEKLSTINIDLSNLDTTNNRPKILQVIRTLKAMSDNLGSLSSIFEFNVIGDENIRKIDVNAFESGVKLNGK